MSVTHNTPQVREAYRKLEKKFAFATRKAASRGGRVLREGLHTGAMPGRIVDGPGRR